MNLKEQLIDEVSLADENGLLADYRNVDNEKQIVWGDLTLTQVTTNKKTFNAEVKAAIKQVEYEATRLGQFTKTMKQHWTCKVAAQ